MSDKMKVMSNERIQDLFNEITQYDVELANNEDPYTKEVYSYDIYSNFWIAEDWEEGLLEETLDFVLPPKRKLVKLFIDNPQFKERVEALAEEIVDNFVAAFEETRETYRDQKESEAQLVREQTERESAKSKLLQTLSKEQRKALQKAFNIAI